MEQVFNAEISGMVGATEIRHDKGVQVVEMMTAKGKKVKITSKSVNEDIAKLQFGEVALFRIEEIDMFMNEYGNMNIRGESVKMHRVTASAATASKAV